MQSQYTELIKYYNTYSLVILSNIHLIALLLLILYLYNQQTYVYMLFSPSIIVNTLVY